MEIPIYEMPVCIDFNTFMDRLGQQEGWNYRDMAGKYTARGRKLAKELKLEWLEQNGYSGKEHCLNKPVSSNVDWAVGSEEMNTRIEINQKFRAFEATHEVPYQDVWHWLLAHSFYEMHNGSVQCLDEGILDEDDEIPDYVRTVLNAIFAAVPTDHPSRKYGSIHFYVHW